MKYLILVPDGLADEKLSEFDNKSPVEYANTPNFDFFAEEGMTGFVRTIPESIKQPGSDTANLSLLGYNPEEFNNLGRGPLEALSVGIDLKDSDVVYRANCVTIENGIMKSSNSSHIESDLSYKYIDYINENFKMDGIKFYKGVGYRHLMKIDTDIIKDFKVKEIETTPPHNIVGEKIKDYLPKGKTSDILNTIMNELTELFKNVELNNNSKHIVSSMWFWGGSAKISIKKFDTIWNKKGAVISGVDLINGIGRAIGFDVLKVEGATAYYDSNFYNKINTALSALKNYDLIYVHTEATDEAGHDKDFKQKVKMTEKFDKEILGPAKEYYESNKDDLRIMISPDHPTPVRLGYHTNLPVPFIIAGAGINKSGNNYFSESMKTENHFESGNEMLKFFFG
jgi:2,3-bisphosphoglycerate-independent phosphoglycerate mutase